MRPDRVPAGFGMGVIKFVIECRVFGREAGKVRAASFPLRSAQNRFGPENDK